MHAFDPVSGQKTKDDFPIEMSKAEGAGNRCRASPSSV